MYIIISCTCIMHIPYSCAVCVQLSVRDLEGAIADLKLRLSSSSSSASSSSAEGGGVKHELRKKIVLLQMALYRMKEEVGTSQLLVFIVSTS